MQRPLTSSKSLSSLRSALLPAIIIVFATAHGLIAAPANRHTTPHPRRSPASSQHSPRTTSRQQATVPVSATRHDAGALGAIAVNQSSQGITLSSSHSAIQARFTLATGKFDVTSAGMNPLGSASLRFRRDGRAYRFPSGLTIINASVDSGGDRVGSYRSISVLWRAHDPAGSLIRTSLRVYATVSAVVFEQSFPNGITGMDAIDFSNVGCAFPVFEAPQQAPEGLRWLSYTYQDWPIPIRGAGWPGVMGRQRWPAGGTDDCIRTPLALFDNAHHCVVLSPLNNPLQQLTVLSQPRSGIPAPAAASTARPQSVVPPASQARRGSAAAASPTIPNPPAGTPGPGIPVPPAPSAPTVQSGESLPQTSGLGGSLASGLNVSSAASAGSEPAATVVAGEDAEVSAALTGGAAGTGTLGTSAAAAPGSQSAATSRVTATGAAGSVSAAGNSATSSTPGEVSDILVGPEGKLKSAPPGAAFRSVLVFGESGVAHAILQWGSFLQRFNGKLRRKPPTDFTAHTLGYWTDNGAAYYYKTEGNAGYTATLQAVHAYDQENHIPVRYYQLDSWWYSKGWDGGTTLWMPNGRLPSGVAGVARSVSAPVALHNRYWSQAAPYQYKGGFLCGPEGCVPIQQGFYDTIFRMVSAWGCRLYEQDWLATQFRKVEPLSTTYGTPDEWLNAMDSAAGLFNLPIQYCMPSMGFFLASSGLPNVTQIRTSRDFSRTSWDVVRLRWMEHAQMSLMAAAVGAAPSKDVLLTTRSSSNEAAAWEQAEALLAILSHGPVGIGDAFGHTDLHLINHLCLEDGILAQPDYPATPVEACVTGDADIEGLPLVTQTGVSHDGCLWRYLLSIDIGDSRALGENHELRAATPRPRRVAVASTALLGSLNGNYICYDYVHGRILGPAGPHTAVDLPGGEGALSYSVMAPLYPDGSALIGDVTKFVTTSDARFKSVSWKAGKISLLLQGPADSEIRLAVYDPNGKPQLSVAGGSVPPEVKFGFSTTTVNSELTDIVAPGVFSGDSPSPSPEAADLYFFHFRLPARSSGGSVPAVITTGAGPASLTASASGSAAPASDAPNP